MKTAASIKAYEVKTPSNPHGAVVGKLVQLGETLILYRSYPIDKALLRKTNALSYDVRAHKAARADGASLVHFADGETIYEADLEAIEERGFLKNNGDGEQVYWPLDEWRVIRATYKPGWTNKVQLLV